MKKLLQSLFILMVIAVTASAQDRTVTETVTSTEDKLPISGVSVRIKGATDGVSTVAGSKYSLKLPIGTTALEFSSIGYESQTKQITVSNVISVALAPDAKVLSEVIVTAVGVEKDKASLGYSADVVKAQDLTNGRQTNIINGLTG